MRRIALILGTALPLAVALPALAEDVVIRIEAKRGAEAAQTAAQGWSSQLPGVVTFPLSDGWIGIALGPMPREQAETRLNELKAAGQVPGDSFISAAQGRNLTPVAASEAATPATEGTAPASPVGAGSTFVPPGSTEAAATEAQPAPEVVVPEVAAPEVAPAPAQYFIRIESSADRAKADETLTKYRETLPDAGLWTLPNGRFAVALGPFEEAAGAEWLGAFKNAKAVPRDAFLAEAAEMGEVTTPGQAPEIGVISSPESQPLPMPPLEDVQRALRWAGHYDGDIDGKDGPRTQSAIANEVVLLRASPDPATAMAELVSRREAWRQQMGLTVLEDAHTGLSMPAPMDKLQFDRSERALSIYGPKDGSGAALILFSQTGGQQEMLDLAGLITALGWVPTPERKVSNDAITLDGRNETHIGHAEGRVIDGRAQGFVLIWPISDPDDQRRLAAEISDGIARYAPAAAEAPAPAAETPAPEAPAEGAANPLTGN